MFVPSPPPNLNSDGFTVPNAANVSLVIFLHGSEADDEQDYCVPAISPAGSVPPVVGALAGESILGRPVFVFAPSTQVKPAWTPGQPREHYKFYKRGLELTDLLNRAEAAGYARRNIIVAGHSAGGWIALTHLARDPNSFAAVVAFAPAFAGRNSGRDVNSGFWVPERDSQIALLRASPPRSLVYSFEGDEFEPFHPLRSVFKKKPNVIFRAMGRMRARQHPAGGEWNHNGAYHLTFADQKKRILQFIEQVTT
jgi:pimeloyl-ACP methyl ester carboxylesterase